MASCNKQDPRGWLSQWWAKQNLSPFQALNEGLGEGVFYRGRILLALCVDVYSSPSAVATDSGSGALGKVCWLPPVLDLTSFTSPIKSGLHSQPHRTDVSGWHCDLTDRRLCVFKGEGYGGKAQTEKEKQKGGWVWKSNIDQQISAYYGLNNCVCGQIYFVKEIVITHLPC